MYVIRVWTGLLLTALGLMAGADRLVAQHTHGATVHPPLIDRALFFGAPAQTQAQLAPDGKHIAFLQPSQGGMTLHLMAREEAPQTARQLTQGPRSVTHYGWSSNSRYLVYQHTPDSTGQVHLYAVAPSHPLQAPRNLTPVPGVQAVRYALPSQDPDVAIVGLNERDPAHPDVYRIDLASGERTLLFNNTAGYTHFVIDAVGAVRLAVALTEVGETVFFNVAGEAPREVLRCTPTETCRPLRFHPDGRRLYMAANLGAADLAGLVLLDVDTGRVVPLEADPEGQVDFGGAWFDDTSGALLATYYEGNRRMVYPRETATRRDFRILDRQIPFGQQWITSSSASLRYHLVEGVRDKDPGSVYLYDRKAGTVELLFQEQPGLDAGVLSSVLAIQFPAQDGTPITGFLTLPKGLDALALPLVVLPHPGPWSRDRWAYNPWVQLLANRGYAVFQPNVRGAAGFGKQFLGAGLTGAGAATRAQDITDGVRYLIGEGLVDSARVAYFGLADDWVGLLAHIPTAADVFAAGLVYTEPDLLGGRLETWPVRPVWQLIAEELETRYTPRNTPMLVVHRAATRVPPRTQVDQWVNALRARGAPVSYLVAQDVGPGLTRSENRMALAAAVERFLADHLGGQVQTPRQPGVAATLDAMRAAAETVGSAPSTTHGKQNP